MTMTQVALETKYTQIGQDKFTKRIQNAKASGTAAETALFNGLDKSIIKDVAEAIFDKAHKYYSNNRVKASLGNDIFNFFTIKGESREDKIKYVNTCNFLAVLGVTSVFNAVFSSRDLKQAVVPTGEVDEKGEKTYSMVEYTDDAVYAEVVRSVGTEIQYELMFIKASITHPKEMAIACKGHLVDQVYGRTYAMRAAAKDLFAAGFEWEPWSPLTIGKVGDFVVSLVLANCKNEFVTVIGYEPGARMKKVKFLTFSDSLETATLSAFDKALLHSSKKVPMLTPPQPWTDLV